MRQYALSIMCLMALAACGSSDEPAQGTRFAGDWKGQGTTVFTTRGLPPAAPSSFPTGLVVFRQVRFTADQAGSIHIEGLPLSGWFDPIPMEAVGDTTLWASGFASPTRPAPSPCDSACASPTDVITVGGGSADIGSDGLLTFVLSGERTLCCRTEFFAVAGVGFHR
jgi:hypothetical protein